ncbi:MAG TPA: O-antigen ligase family protein [Burkholderiales bacterium]|nr:O-antigen ligase family protein [Burkholderiales bacterium]
MDERVTAVPASSEPLGDAMPTAAARVSLPPVPVCVTAVAVMIMVMVGKISEWVPGLAAIPIVKIAFLIAAISAFRNRAALPAVRVRSLRIARPAVAFMMLAILSVSFSIYKSNTLILSQLILILLLSMTLLLKVTQTLRDVERLLLGFAAASASLSVGLILNYHGGRAAINDNFDPNDIAYALDTALPIVLALRPRNSRLGWSALSGLALLMVLSVLLTGSRGGAIGFSVITLLIVAFPLSRDRNGAVKRFSLGRTVGKFVVLIAAAAVIWGYLPQATQERMATLLNLQNDYSADSNLKGSRWAIWQRDVGMALERPIGYGLGSAEAVDGLGGGQYRAAHNCLVQVFVELGALGLLLYLYSYLTTWRNLGRISQLARQASSGGQDAKAALYARAIRIGLAGNLAAGFFLSQGYSAALWMLVATAAALVRITLPARGTPPAVEPSEASPQATVAGVRS